MSIQCFFGFVWLIFSENWIDQHLAADTVLVCSVSFFSPILYNNSMIIISILSKISHLENMLNVWLCIHFITPHVIISWECVKRILTHVGS